MNALRYMKMNKQVLDPACSIQSFYFDKHPDYLLTGDIRSVSLYDSKFRKIEINPDQIMDFRKLDFPDESFNLVIFDPPHLWNCGKTSSMGMRYGVLNKDTWKKDIRSGFDECWRVLKKGGTLIFKWTEKDVTIAELIYVLGRTPLIGNKQPKTNGFWFVFYKPEESNK